MKKGDESQVSTVVFTVFVKFFPSELKENPARYIGNDKDVKRALVEGGLADDNGYLTDKGSKYFASASCIDKNQAQQSSVFYNGAHDNYDWECAGREYAAHLASLPRQVALRFSFLRSEFGGDPPRLMEQGMQGVHVDPVLFDNGGFFDHDGYLTLKGIEVFLNSGTRTPADSKESDVKGGDLADLMNFIDERYKFDGDTYPDLLGANEKQKFVFAVNHSVLRMQKLVGGLAAQVEAAQHSNDMDQGELTKANTEMLVNVLKLASVLETDANKLIFGVPNVMKSR